VQNVINKSDVRGEMTQAGERQNQWVFRLRLKVSVVGEEQISSGIEFQMTAVEQRKERDALVLDGMERR